VPNLVKQYLNLARIILLSGKQSWPDLQKLLLMLLLFWRECRKEFGVALKDDSCPIEFRHPVMKLPVGSFFLINGITWTSLPHSFFFLQPPPPSFPLFFKNTQTLIAMFKPTAGEI
jgi:hypothetical protein